jgi:hypothetical protein
MPRLPAGETIRFLIVVGNLGHVERAGGDTGFKTCAFISVKFHNAVGLFSYCARRANAYARGLGAMVAAHRKREKHRLLFSFVSFCRTPSDGAGINLIPVFTGNGTGIAAHTFVLIECECSSHDIS